MERIDVKQLNDNVFETIGKEWLLVCSGDKENFNMMTAWMVVEQASGCGLHSS